MLSIVNVENSPSMRRRLQSPLFPFISGSRGYMDSKYSANFVFFTDQYVIYISVGEIELLCKLFLACFEETLYKLRLIQV